MKLMDGGLTFLLIGAALCLAVGYGGFWYSGEDDSFVEEQAEKHLENIIEKTLDLDDEALEDKIDLTPWSDEND